MSSLFLYLYELRQTIGLLFGTQSSGAASIIDAADAIFEVSKKADIDEIDVTLNIKEKNQMILVGSRQIFETLRRFRKFAICTCG